MVDVFHACIRYNIIAVQQRLKGKAPLIEEIPGMIILIIDCTHGIKHLKTEFILNNIYIYKFGSYLTGNICITSSL
jgi:hypothetical protein